MSISILLVGIADFTTKISSMALLSHITRLVNTVRKYGIKCSISNNKGLKDDINRFQ